jgi:hypothetical protein
MWACGIFASIDEGIDLVSPASHLLHQLSSFFLLNNGQQDMQLWLVLLQIHCIHRNVPAMGQVFQQDRQITDEAVMLGIDGLSGWEALRDFDGCESSRLRKCGLYVLPKYNLSELHLVPMFTTRAQSMRFLRPAC